MLMNKIPSYSIVGAPWGLTQGLSNSKCWHWSLKANEITSGMPRCRDSRSQSRRGDACEFGGVAVCLFRRLSEPRKGVAVMIWTLLWYYSSPRWRVSMLYDGTSPLWLQLIRPGWIRRCNLWLGWLNQSFREYEVRRTETVVGCWWVLVFESHLESGSELGTRQFKVKGDLKSHELP